MFTDNNISKGAHSHQYIYIRLKKQQQKYK